MGTTLLGRVKIVAPIGRGGMGSVWLATHLGLDIPCAMKFMEGEFSHSAEAHLLLGISYAWKDDAAGAETEFRRATELDRIRGFERGCDRPRNRRRGEQCHSNRRT